MLDEGYRVEQVTDSNSDSMVKKYLPYLKKLNIQLAILLIATLLVYANSMNAPFYLDDYHSIVENPIIHDISSMYEKRDFQIMRLTGTYSLALNYAIHQTSVFGYHLVNITIHFLTGLAVFFLLRALILAQLQIQKSNNSKVILSENYLLYLPFFSALIFLLHPLQTQAISYIVQRHASLASLFYISAMASFIYARLNQHQTKQWIFYFLTGLFSLLALLSKENTVTLVGAIFLLEILFFQTFSIKKVIIWSLLAVFLTALLAFCLHYFMGISFELIDRYTHTADVKHISRIEYFSTQMLVLWTYIKLFFIPIGLHLDYDIALQKSFFNFAVIIALIAHLTILVGSLFIAKNKPILIFAVFFYYIAHSIESGIIPILDLAFEHRSYLPNLGLAIITAWLLISVLDYLNNKLYATIIICLLFLVLSVLTIQRNNQWANPIIFYENEVTITPNKERSWAELGKVYMKEKQFDKALKAFAKALNLGRDGNAINALPTTFLNTYLALLYTKKLNKAQHFEKIMPINSLTIHDRSIFYFMKANRLVANKEYNAAIKSYQLATKFNPRNLNAQANLAALYIEVGKKQQGLLLLNQVLQISPQHKMALMYQQKYQQ